MKNLGIRKSDTCGNVQPLIDTVTAFAENSATLLKIRFVGK